MEEARGGKERENQVQTAAALSDDDNKDVKKQILLFLVQYKQQQFKTWTIYQAQGAASIDTSSSSNGQAAVEIQGKWRRAIVAV